MHVSNEELRDTYWVTLLGYLGGTGFAHEQGLIGTGDDRAVRNAMSMFSVSHREPRPLCAASPADT